MRIILLFTLLPLFAFSQKLSSIETDKFTGKKRVETKYLVLKASLTQTLAVKLRAVDNSIFLTLQGDIGLGVVGTSDALIFLFDDKTTTSIYPTSIQTTDGYGSEEKYYHQYQLSKDQLGILCERKVISLRRYYNSNYIDIDIADKKADKFMDLAKMINSEL